jgi:hypothetical protein
MKVITRTTLCFLIACFSSGQRTLFAQSSDHENNLSVCMIGGESCNHSDLTAAESHEVAVSAHHRNVADCRIGTNPAIAQNSQRPKLLRWPSPSTNVMFPLAWTDPNRAITPH